MTVKEIFDLRHQGRIEEAYEAIRPLYANHKGKYTTLCMFWTAVDVFKLRLEQHRFDEAEKIYKALLRVLPHLHDPDGRAAAFLHSAAQRLESLTTQVPQEPLEPLVTDAAVYSTDNTPEWLDLDFNKSPQESTTEGLNIECSTSPKESTAKG